MRNLGLVEDQEDKALRLRMIQYRSSVDIREVDHLRLKLKLG